MATQRLRLPDGREVDAEAVGFQTASENFNEYLTDDGVVIRLKAVVTQIFRVEGEFSLDGQPMYATASMNVQVVDAPDNLKRKN